MTQTQANPERQIRVELELGDSYAVALGEESSAKAKQLAEAALVEALEEKVNFFFFCPFIRTIFAHPDFSYRSSNS
ncbi:MAG: hypothetical protein GY702_16970 [Desulfobulbaceae bacterium]|nr:hypothetical protein [Desulfobulbaceae bacterium]